MGLPGDWKAVQEPRCTTVSGYYWQRPAVVRDIINTFTEIAV